MQAKAYRTITELHSRGILLNEEEKQALNRCFGVRGKYAGYLKAKAPSWSTDRLANTIWNALQPNPYKVSVMTLCLLLGEEEKELYNKLAYIKWPDDLDKDKEQLSLMGAW